MKKFLSLFISYIMLFNLAVPSFAQKSGNSTKISDAQRRMMEEFEQLNPSLNVYSNTDPKWQEYQRKYNQQAQKNMGLWT
jgi:hypothetical protein